MTDSTKPADSTPDDYADRIGSPWPVTSTKTLARHDAVASAVRDHFASTGDDVYRSVRVVLATMDNEAPAGEPSKAQRAVTRAVGYALAILVLAVLLPALGWIVGHILMPWIVIGFGWIGAL